MAFTEKLARVMWCPFVRDGGGASNVNMRDEAGGRTAADGYTCIGSRCMLWQWEHAPELERAVFIAAGRGDILRDAQSDLRRFLAALKLDLPEPPPQPPSRAHDFEGWRAAADAWEAYWPKLSAWLHESIEAAPAAALFMAAIGFVPVGGWAVQAVEVETDDLGIRIRLKRADDPQATGRCGMVGAHVSRAA